MFGASWAEPCYVENWRDLQLFTRSLNIITFKLGIKGLTFCSYFW